MYCSGGGSALNGYTTLDSGNKSAGIDQARISAEGPSRRISAVVEMPSAKPKTKSIAANGMIKRPTCKILYANSAHAKSDIKDKARTISNILASKIPPRYSRNESGEAKRLRRFLVQISSRNEMV